VTGEEIALTGYQQIYHSSSWSVHWNGLGHRPDKPDADPSPRL